MKAEIYEAITLLNRPRPTDEEPCDRLIAACKDWQERAVKRMITGVCSQFGLVVVAIVPVEAGTEILATSKGRAFKLRLALAMNGEYLCSAHAWQAPSGEHMASVSAVADRPEFALSKAIIKAQRAWRGDSR